MDTVTLTARSTLRYKLCEKPQRPDDGFLIKAGQSIVIVREALNFFHAIDMTGKPTTKWSLT